MLPNQYNQDRKEGLGACPWIREWGANPATPVGSDLRLVPQSKRNR